MNRKDLLSAGGVTLVLALGWYQFVWQSQGASATKARQDTAAAVASVAQLDGQVASLERTKAELAGKAELAAKLEQAIPPTPELSSLVKQLQATAKARSVSLATISTGELGLPNSTATGSSAAASGTPPSQMALTLVMHGDYAAVLSFVNDLSAIPRLVVVDSVTVNRNDTQDPSGSPVGPNDVSATVSAKVFSTQAPPAAPGAATTTTPAVTSGGTKAAPTTAPKGGL